MSKYDDAMYYWYRERDEKYMKILSQMMETEPFYFDLYFPFLFGIRHVWNMNVMLKLK